MPQDVKIWEIGNDESLTELEKLTPDSDRYPSEESLEKWIENDISIVSRDLLVIGRQVEAEVGPGLGSVYIDLLCLDRNGDLVILELKGAKSPRDVAAQALDYASLAEDISADEIQEIANDYFQKKDNGKTLDSAFTAQFQQELPETLKENDPSMLVVASALDSSTERIINYLSKRGIPINAVTFQYFMKGEKRYLARVFLVEPEEAGKRIRRPGARQRLRPEELERIADSKGVRELYSKLAEGLATLFDYTSSTKTSLTLIGVQEKSPGVTPGRNTILSLLPDESDISQGVKFRVYLTRFSAYFRLDEDEARSLLPANKKTWAYYRNAPPEWTGYEGFFKDAEEVKGFLAKLKERKKE